MSFCELFGSEPHGGAFVTFSIEVRGVAEHEEEEDHGYNEACDDDQECVLDSANVATGLNGSAVALRSVRLLSFHNLIVLFLI